MTWDAQPDSRISKADAIVAIRDMASRQNLTNYKVFIGDAQIATPDDMPEMVDMNTVRISAVLDQA